MEAIYHGIHEVSYQLEILFCIFSYFFLWTFMNQIKFPFSVKININNLGRESISSRWENPAIRSYKNRESNRTEVRYQYFEFCYRFFTYSVKLSVNFSVEDPYKRHYILKEKTDYMHYETMCSVLYFWKIH